MLLPQSDSDLAKLLEKNDEFNIRTIAVVLVMYAIEIGEIESKERANRLPIKGWKSSVGRYNSPNAEEARKHSDGVFAYIDDVKILLNQRDAR